MPFLAGRFSSPYVPYMDSRPALFESDAPLGASRPIIRRIPEDASETVRSEADEILQEMEHQDQESLAASFKRSLANYDGDRDMAAAIIADLRRRAAAGIRFWPGLDPAGSARTGHGPADITDDNISW